MGQLWNRRISATAMVICVTTLSACTAALKPNTDANIEDFITAVTDQSGTVSATLVQGPPPAEAGGPAATVSGIAVMINGGSASPTVTAGSSFTHVIFAIDGLNNYYDLTLPAGVSTQGLVVVTNPNAFASNLSFAYAVSNGTVGAYARQSVRFLQVGTGDIQISVAWDDSSDVDLHVVDPNGEHIYFAHRDAASGGTLDLDANAACGRNSLPDGTTGFVSNENVVWPTGRAIPGTYTVFLHYWSACNNPGTNWVATIQRANAAPQIFTGSFGNGDPNPIDTVSVFTQ